MNRLVFVILFLASFLCSNAQVDTKYLTGAVPEIDGKVQFTRTINTGDKYTEDKLFEAVNQWAENNYDKNDKKDQTSTNRLLLSNPAEKNIACAGQKNLVFKKNTFVLDQAILSYQLILGIENTNCIATVRYMKYTYPDFKSPEPAEKLITDKVALDDDKDKLNRYYDKFRIYTIDSVNSIFDSLEKYINGVTIAPAAVVSTTPAIPTPAIIEGNMPGYKKVDSNKIPASMSNKEVLLLTGTVQNPGMLFAKWNGTSTLMDKVQAIVDVDTKDKMDNSDTYTILFFTEIYDNELNSLREAGGNAAGKIKTSGFTPVATPLGIPALSEAWMIIECKKSGEIPSATANNKTCLGEILNVWIK